MPQQVLALEIDAHELKAALIETTFRDYRVVGVYRDPVRPADGSLAEQLSAFLQRHQLAPTTVLSCIPGDQVSLRTFFLPFRDRRRLDQTVPFELESQVPFGLDDVIVDYQVVHRDRAGSSILAALVQRKDLEDHLAVLAAAGLDPKIVDFESLAALNVLSLVGPELPATFAYVGGGECRAVVALYRNRHLVGVRTLVGSEVSHNGAGEAADDGSATPTSIAGGRPTVDRDRAAAMVAEIRWTLLALNGAPLDDPLPCIVAGEGPTFAAVIAALTARTDLAVQRLEDAPLRNLPAPVRTQLAAFASPLGLALREVAPDGALGVNFRQGEFAYHRGQDELRRGLLRSGVLAAAVVVLFLTHTYMGFRQLATRLAAVDEEIYTVYAQTLPDAPRVADPKAQIQAEIDAAQRKLQMLGGLVAGGGLTAIDVLRTITNAVPDTIKMDTDEYVMDTDGVRMKVKTDSFESVDAIKQQLLNTHYFGDVQVKDVKTATDGKVDFRLVLALTKAGEGPKQ
jgi:general secretion pathway protein L